MSKLKWKPGTMVYPVPPVMVSCGDMENSNILTIAWTGIICTDPAMTYISVRKERHSYDIIKRSGEFVINLASSSLAKSVDFCGVKSGREVNKFKKLGLTPIPSRFVKCPSILESPVSIECKVKEIIKLGSHDMFLAEVLGVTVDKDYLDEKGRFNLNNANLIAYSHGEYYTLGEYVGKFGYSIKKK